ncbi:hypothetical protein DUD43_00630 [Alcaligenes faecalis]|nr:hypothetical protein DUD43_00630 [Alcaligenes faecalis]
MGKFHFSAIWPTAPLHALAAQAPFFMLMALDKRLGGHLKYFKQGLMWQLMMASGSQARLLPHI